MKKHKFNWVDGLVIVVIVLLIAGTCVKFLVLDRDTGAEKGVTFTYDLRIAGLRDVTVNALQVGDTVYDNTGKGAVGVITDIAVSDAVTNINYPDGTVRQGTIEDRYDVVLTLSVSGTVSGDSYEVGTYDIQVNSSDTYFTKYSIWMATVTAIHGPDA